MRGKKGNKRLLRVLVLGALLSTTYIGGCYGSGLSADR